MPHRRERGFTLIEVVIAAAILSAGVIAFQQSFGNTIRARAAAAELEARLALAEAVLALELTAEEPLEGVRAGFDDARRAWTTERRFLAPVDARGGLWWVEVSVAPERGGGVVTLTTMQLAAVPSR